ncbi:hypothetical protein LARV_00627 [Longilinea arvoryzae]|uniref:Uncharacterized protein n=1 Tax=Longilinea arvoryzae TaxID=360412 RepID=A0A0S7B720_9CHLR|nr:DUF6391 domain-containing protein [Longilinea arvoryzae]GAP12887.1 hypothetical protein LARV_00627 [Longilinea arvoryzae]
MPTLKNILAILPFERIRRHHGIEHATLQVLAEQNPYRSLAGYSDAEGFWVVGEVPTEELQAAVAQAIARLIAGEKRLAIHPNCGTNFVASGMVAGSLAWLAMLPSRGRRRSERWSLVVVLSTLGLLLSQPLGPWLQANVTTSADVGTLHVQQITRYVGSNLPLHRIVLKS